MQASATTIIAALGGSTATGMCCCPAHDDKKPSLHVRDGANGKKTLVHCKAGCSQESVISALRSRGLWGSGKADQPSVTDDKNQPSREYEDYENFKRAGAILRAAAGAGAGPPAAYLNGRGIEANPSGAMLLPGSNARRLVHKGYPTMVMPIVRNGKLVGAHTTLLNRDATKRIKRGKRTWGPIKGGYIQLGKIDPDKPLIVAEVT